MSEHVQVGVFVPTREAMVGRGWSAPGRLIDFARRAEELGYASVWVTDSLASTRLEPLTVLTATAASTSRLLVGAGTLIPAYRQPLNAAHVIATVDRLSAGRLVLAVGGGFPGRADREFRMVGVPMKRRFTLLDDIVALWRTLWTEPRAATFRGEVLHYDDLPEIPLPHSPGGPPIWLAGGTAAALRRTARLYDGWLPYPPDVAEYARGLDALSGADRPVTPALMATVLIEPDRARARERLDAYCRAFYDAPASLVESIQLVVAGDETEVAKKLRPYVDAGARHLVLRLAVLDADDQFDQLARIAELLLANAGSEQPPITMEER